MTSETPNLHVSNKLNISKTKQDIEKLKTPLRLVRKCCSVVLKIGSKIFSLQWHFKSLKLFNLKIISSKIMFYCVPVFVPKYSRQTSPLVNHRIVILKLR